MLKAIFIATAALALTAPAQAQDGIAAFYTLGDLDLECTNETVACDSYLAAITDMNTVYGADSNAWNAICLKNKTSINELRQVLLQHSEEHRDLHGEAAAYHVTIALRSAYPCK